MIKVKTSRRSKIPIYFPALDKDSVCILPAVSGTGVHEDSNILIKMDAGVVRNKAAISIFKIPDFLKIQN
jgi:hypothetical protein